MLDLANLKILSFEEIISNTSEINGEIEKYLEAINAPCFQLREVNVSSKLISDWIKLGLLNQPLKLERRREFSLVEAVWIKFIEELRYFGVSIQNIQRLKKNIFDDSLAEFKKNIQLLEPNQFHSQTVKKFIEDLKREIVSNKDFDNAFSLGGFNTFSILIGLHFSVNLQFAFYSDEEGGYFIGFGKALHNINPKLSEQLVQKLSQRSFSLINIQSIISKFFDNDKLKGNIDLYSLIMTPDEKEVIEKIRTGNYKEITIKLDNGGITQLRLGKKQDEDLIRKISRLMKKGDYKEIHLKVRDGMTIHSTETDIIKVR